MSALRFIGRALYRLICLMVFVHTINVVHLSYTMATISLGTTLSVALSIWLLHRIYRNWSGTP